MSISIFFLAIAITTVTGAGAAAGPTINQASPHLPLQLDPIVGGPPFKNFLVKNKQKIKADLPRTLRPTHYTLHIRPILDDLVEDPFTAPGHIEIVVECHDVTNKVILHRSKDMVVDDGSISLFQLNQDGSSGGQVGVVGTSYDEANAFFTIGLANSLSIGESYKLSINFTSQINEGASGLYRAQYQTPEGEIRYMATTQFQSNGARMAFPCFDEPGFKATFDISIGRKNELNSLCNTLPKEVGVEDPSLPSGWVWDVYNRTVPMSSYLVAIIVSDFVCENADSSIFEGRPVRVCGPSYQIEDQKGATFPADVGAKVMRLFEETLKYPYEMYKVDNAAIPRDYFGPGAMENWGLVTYRDNYILFYEGQSTESDKSGVWSIMAHELAHQWFGDLVTCADWTYIWLNEGFATYMATKYGRSAPEFDTEREIVSGQMQGSMSYDIGRDEPVYTPLGQSGGTIIYDKGASLLHMLEGFLGQQILFEGLADYLRRNAYQPVTQDQLFEVLNEHAQANGKIPPTKTIKQIMDTWTLQAGHPLVKVSRVDEANVYISQQKYLPATQQPDATLWEVPIAIATAVNSNFSNHTPALWLNTSGENWQIDPASSWLVLNTDAMAYFRVLYDDELLTQIHALLAQNLDNLSGQSRSQLIDDYFSFSRLGHEPIEKALELTKYLDNEDDHIVWYSVFRHFDLTIKMLENRPEATKYLLPKFEAVLSRNLANWTLPLNTVGSGSRVIWLSRMLDRACSLDSEPGRGMALNLFRQWMAEPSKLIEIMPPDFESTILCHGVSQLGTEGYDFLMDQYVNADPYSLHKTRFLNALSCSSESKNVQNFVVDNLLLLKKSGQQPNLPQFLQKLAAHPVHRQFVHKILLKHASLLVKKERIGNDEEEEVAGILSVLSNFYNSQLQLDEMTTLVEKLRPILPTQVLILEEAIDGVKENIKWMTTLANPAIKWFSVNGV